MEVSLKLSSKSVSNCVSIVLYSSVFSVTLHTCGKNNYYWIYVDKRLKRAFIWPLESLLKSPSKCYEPSKIVESNYVSVCMSRYLTSSFETEEIKDYVYGNAYMCGLTSDLLTNDTILNNILMYCDRLSIVSFQSTSKQFRKKYIRTVSPCILTDLPTSLRQNIFNFLNIKELGSLRECSSKMDVIVKDDAGLCKEMINGLPNPELLNVNCLNWTDFNESSFSYLIDNELIGPILGHLDFKTLLSLFSTCKTLNLRKKIYLKNQLECKVTLSNLSSAIKEPSNVCSSYPTLLIKTHKSNMYDRLEVILGNETARFKRFVRNMNFHDYWDNNNNIHSIDTSSCFSYDQEYHSDEYSENDRCEYSSKIHVMTEYDIYERTRATNNYMLSNSYSHDYDYSDSYDDCY